MAAVRQQINIDSTPRTVWAAFTTAEGLTSWWVDEAPRVDARKGGRIVVVSEGDDGEPVEESGIFHEVRPTRKIEIAWDQRGKAETAGSRIVIQIARDGDETRVSIVHSGGELFDDAEWRGALDKEWKSALKSLRSSLEG